MFSRVGAAVKRGKTRMSQKWSMDQSKIDAYNVRRRTRKTISSELRGNAGEHRKPCKLTVQIVTYNVGESKPEDDYTDMLKGGHDIVVIGLQEVDMSVSGAISEQTESGNKWQTILSDQLNLQEPYRLIDTMQLMGLMLLVWVRAEHLEQVYNVRQCVCRFGHMGGTIANKGAVALRFSLYCKRFCFVCTHLAAGETQAEARNKNFVHICKHVRFKMAPDADDELDCGMQGSLKEKWHHSFDIEKAPKGYQDFGYQAPGLLSGYDYVWIFGDLNYRIDLEPSDVKQKVAAGNLEALQAKDQLKFAQENGKAFQGWKEGDLDFAPTYKYDKGKTVYAMEKNRAPSWTDRILYYPATGSVDSTATNDDMTNSTSNWMKQKRYRRHEILQSDHRPVSSLFEVKCCKIDELKFDDALAQTVKEVDLRPFDERADEIDPLAIAAALDEEEPYDATMDSSTDNSSFDATPRTVEADDATLDENTESAATATPREANRLPTPTAGFSQSSEGELPMPPPPPLEGYKGMPSPPPPLPPKASSPSSGCDSESDDYDSDDEPQLTTRSSTVRFAPQTEQVAPQQVYEEEQSDHEDDSHRRLQPHDYTKTTHASSNSTDSAATLMAIDGIDAPLVYDNTSDDSLQKTDESDDEMPKTRERSHTMSDRVSQKVIDTVGVVPEQHEYLLEQLSDTMAKMSDNERAITDLARKEFELRRALEKQAALTDKQIKHSEQQVQYAKTQLHKEQQDADEKRKKWQQDREREQKLLHEKQESFENNIQEYKEQREQQHKQNDSVMTKLQHTIHHTQQVQLNIALDVANTHQQLSENTRGFQDSGKSSESDMSTTMAQSFAALQKQVDAATAERKFELKQAEDNSKKIRARLQSIFTHLDSSVNSLYKEHNNFNCWLDQIDKSIEDTHSTIHSPLPSTDRLTLSSILMGDNDTFSHMMNDNDSHNETTSMTPLHRRLESPLAATSTPTSTTTQTHQTTQNSPLTNSTPYSPQYTQSTQRIKFSPTGSPYSLPALNTLRHPGPSPFDAVPPSLKSVQGWMWKRAAGCWTKKFYGLEEYSIWFLSEMEGRLHMTTIGDLKRVEGNVDWQSGPPLPKGVPVTGSAFKLITFSGREYSFYCEGTDQYDTWIDAIMLAFESYQTTKSVAFGSPSPGHFSRPIIN